MTDDSHIFMNEQNDNSPTPNDEASDQAAPSPVADVDSHSGSPSIVTEAQSVNSTSTPEAQEPSSNGESPSSASTENVSSDQEETFRQVLQFKRRHGIVTRFNGICYISNGPLSATCPQEIDDVLRREDIDQRWVTSEFIMEMKANGLKVKKADVERAVRKAFARAMMNRRKEIMIPLMEPLSSTEYDLAMRDWRRLASVFAMDASLTIAILGHYIWQVKQKTLNRTVTNHLMPIVVSVVQGSGKTTLAINFLGPLAELANGPVVLTDFADTRSRDIFRYPATLVDDVGRIPANMVATLKSVITADKFDRRILGTSMNGAIRQRSTLFGTANNSIEDLIPDHTGHRRFVSMPFRNGSVEKGGDPEVWRIVTETNYVRLWRSINVFAPSPIDACLDELFAHQAASIPVGPVMDWIRGIDLLSDDFMRIKTRYGVPARELYDQFLRDTGSAMSQTRFGAEVKRLLHEPQVPFADFVRLRDGRYYTLKPNPDASNSSVQ